MLIEHGAACLAAMSLRSPTNSAKIVECGAIEVLVRCMRSHSDKSSMLRQGRSAQPTLLHTHTHTHKHTYTHTHTHIHTHTHTHIHKHTHTHTHTHYHVSESLPKNNWRFHQDVQPPNINNLSNTTQNKTKQNNTQAAYA